MDAPTGLLSVAYAKHPILPLAETPRSSRSPQWRRRIPSVVGFLILALVLVFCGYEGSVGSANSLLQHRPLVRRSALPVAKRETLASGIERPPVLPKSFAVTAEDFKKLVDDELAKEKAVVDGIVKNVSPDTATFENTVREYIYHEDETFANTAVLTIYPYASTDSKLVDAAVEQASRLYDKSSDTWYRQDFFKLVDSVYKAEKKDPKLSEEDRKLLQSVRDEFDSTGLDIPEEKTKRLDEISQRLGELEGEFADAIASDNTTVYSTREEFAGVDEHFLDTLEVKGEGKYKGKLALPVQLETNFFAVIYFCTNATTRARTYLAYANRAPSNVDRLEEAIVLRDEYARLNGYDTYATLRIESNMAKTPKAVDDFLANIRDKVTPTSDMQLNRLKALKAADVGDLESDPFLVWDNFFYQAREDETTYKVDKNLVTSYFPSVFTMQGLLDLYGQLYGLRFVKIEGEDRDELSPTGKGEDLVWYPDVEIYALWNDGYTPASGEGRDDGFVGYLYLDLFYREGKAGSGAYQSSFDLGFEKADGSRNPPSTILVCNFLKSKTAKPSLLSLEDVGTIMHEMGHGMHQLTSRVKYARFHGPGGTPVDFLEAPSQLMENFAYEPEVLQHITKHWSYLSPEAKAAWEEEQNSTDTKQPAETMPEELLNDVVKNKNAHTGMLTLAQLVYGIYDMAIHEPESHEAAEAIDSTSLYNHIRKDVSKIDGPEILGRGWHWGHRQSTISHYMGGYAASYYAYLWSKVYCIDAFYAGFKQNPYSREVGTKWRRLVLEPGGSKDPEALLEAFLGRKPNDQAFFDDMDIKTGYQRGR